MTQRSEWRVQLQSIGAAFLASTLGATTGCGSRGDPVPTEASAPTSQVEFAQSTLVIDRLGQAMDLPLVVGSKPSPATLYSSDESIVEIGADGKVQAHRNGSVEIRTRGGRSRLLNVLVKSVVAIHLVPSSSVLQPGEEVRLRVVADPGDDEVPPSAVVWSTSAPDIGFVRDGVLRVWKPGTLKIRAQYGSAEALASAEIQNQATSRIDPPRARLQVGEIRFFRVEPPGGATGAWSSSKATVLVSKSDGLFLAVGTGRAKACHSTPERELCSEVEVVR